MKNLRKCRALAVLLAVLMTLSMFSTLNVSAVSDFQQQISASQSQLEKLYFKPNSSWLGNNARFAIYLTGGTSGNAWVSMTATGDGYYVADVPNANYSKLYFCRMNGATTENSWGNYWNKTVAMEIPASDTNCFTLDNGIWNNATGSWGVYTPAEAKTLYFKPNSSWLSGNSRFAVYLSGGTNGNAWVSMTATSDGYYTADIVISNYTKLYFCRMNATATENSWSTCCNKTVAMNIPAENEDCFTLDSGIWNNATGNWGKYTVAEAKTLYFKPNSSWLSGNSRFAVYLSGGTNGSTWFSMTASDNGYYTADVVIGNYTKIYFCRMNGSTTENSWSSCWNKSVAMNIPAENEDCFTLDNGIWNNATGNWGAYTPAEAKVVYFKPNSNWVTNNARFAVYLSGGTSAATWVSMTAGENGYYTANIPSDSNYSKVIFCRMNGSVADNSWGNLWNKTISLDFSIDTKNCFTLNEGIWNNATGVWSTYGVIEEPTNPTEDPTKTTTDIDVTVKQGDVVNLWVELTLPENGKDLSGWTVEMLYDDEVFDVNKNFADGNGFASGTAAIDYALGKSDTVAELPGGFIVQGNLNKYGKAKFTDANLSGFKYTGKTTKLVCIQLTATKDADTTLEYKYLDLIDVEFGSNNYLDKTENELLNGAYSKIKYEIA